MVTIAVPIFNRLDLLRNMAKSLYDSDLEIPYQIILYDDCSTEFSVATLKELFPNAIKVIRHQKNLKADMNMHYMYRDFLNYSSDFLFNADSDLIFSKEWLKKSLELIEKTDGVLSIFNTASHETSRIISEELCIKRDLGAAGTLFKKKRVEEIIQEFPTGSEMFDWKWSEFLNNRDVQLYCVNHSMVQHIGVSGQNSKSETFDYGNDFIVDSLFNAEVIDKTMSIYVEQTKQRIVEIQEYYQNSREYRIGGAIWKLAKMIFYPVKLVRRKLLK